MGRGGGGKTHLRERRDAADTCRVNTDTEIDIGRREELSEDAIVQGEYDVVKCSCGRVAEKGGGKSKRLKGQRGREKPSG